MNVEELFEECFKSDAIKAKEEFRPTPWLTVREREFAQFCIQKERERVLEVYRELRTTANLIGLHTSQGTVSSLVERLESEISKIKNENND